MHQKWSTCSGVVFATGKRLQERPGGWAGDAVSEHREAGRKARPAGRGEQERPGKAVSDGEAGDDVECLRRSRRGDLRRHSER